MPDFPVWPECNEGCVFCSNPVEGFRDTAALYALPELKKKLAAWKAGEKTFAKFDGVPDYFNLTGGEPTLHPDFLALLAHLRREFPSAALRLLSNARLLAYEDFARRLCGVAQRPFELAVPLFGGEAKAHDALSRTPGSFEQTTAGLRNYRKARKPGQTLEVRVILHALQMRPLEGLLDLLLGELAWADRTAFMFVELEGHAERHADRLAMTMSDCAGGLDALFGKLSRVPEPRLYHFPLCTLSERLRPLARRTLDPAKVVWLEACEGCRLRPGCVGVHKSYPKLTGAPDIRRTA